MVGEAGPPLPPSPFPRPTTRASRNEKKGLTGRTSRSNPPPVVADDGLPQVPERDHAHKAHRPPRGWSWRAGSGNSHRASTDSGRGRRRRRGADHSWPVHVDGAGGVAHPRLGHGAVGRRFSTSSGRRWPGSPGNGDPALVIQRPQTTRSSGSRGLLAVDEALGGDHNRQIDRQRCDPDRGSPAREPIGTRSPRPPATPAQAPKCDPHCSDAVRSPRLGTLRPDPTAPIADADGHRRFGEPRLAPPCRG